MQMEWKINKLKQSTSLWDMYFPLQRALAIHLLLHHISHLACLMMTWTKINEVTVHVCVSGISKRALIRWWTTFNLTSWIKSHPARRNDLSIHFDFQLSSCVYLAQQVSVCALSEKTESITDEAKKVKDSSNIACTSNINIDHNIHRTYATLCRRQPKNFLNILDTNKSRVKLSLCASALFFSPHTPSKHCQGGEKNYKFICRFIM